MWSFHIIDQGWPNCGSRAACDSWNVNAVLGISMRLILYLLYFIAKFKIRYKIESYREKLQSLLEDFQNRFKDLHALKSSLGFISNPFLIDVISDGCPFPSYMLEVVSHFEMELLDLQ